MAAALALAGAAAFPALAGAAAPRPSSPDDDAVAGTRPTFGWTSGSAATGIARYEVVVEMPLGPVEVARAGPGVLTATSTIDLPDDTRLRWLVRLVDNLGRVQATSEGRRRFIRVASVPAPPTVVTAPAAIGAVTTPSFTWTGTRISSRWEVMDTSGAAVQSGEVPTGGGAATLTALADGAYRFEVVQRNLAGAEGPAASVAFRVDATPPAPLGLRADRPSPSVGTTPAFSWTGLEAGAVVSWRVTGSGGSLVQGPADTPDAGVRPDPAPPGSYLFEARQVDAGGNAGPWASEPFAILPGPAGASAGTSATLPARNVKRLIPRVGSRVHSLRPTLRWTRGPKGTRIYNVQVFLVTPDRTLRKTLSAFPTSRRYTIPKGARLARGACYVWRVWPYRGSTFTPSPLGVSHFCVARTLK
jgi:hypothetical protein